MILIENIDSRLHFKAVSVIKLGNSFYLYI